MPNPLPLQRLLKRLVVPLICLLLSASTVTPSLLGGEPITRIKPLAAPVRIIPIYGFEGKSKEGFWSPVTVEITHSPTNPAAELDGEVRLHVWSSDQEHKKFFYSRPFRIVGPGTKAVTVYWLPTYIPLPPGEKMLEVSIFDRKTKKDLVRIAVSRASLPGAHLPASRKLIVSIMSGDRANKFNLTPLCDRQRARGNPLLRTTDIRDWVEFCATLKRVRMTRRPRSQFVIYQRLPESLQNYLADLPEQTPPSKDKRVLFIQALNAQLREEHGRVFYQPRKFLNLLLPTEIANLNKRNFRSQYAGDKAYLNRLILEAIFPKLLVKRFFPTPLLPQDQKNWTERLQLTPATIQPENAPDNAIGYQGVSLLIWDTPDPQHLRPGQLSAIKNWVRQGGHLLCTFRNTGSLPPLDALADILPATIVGRSQANLYAISRQPDAAYGALFSGVWEYEVQQWRTTLPEILAENGRTTFEFQKLVPSHGRPLVVVTKNSTEENPPTASPWLVRGQVGMGWVTMLAADPAVWPLRKHPGLAALLGRASGLIFDGRDLDALGLNRGDDDYAFYDPGSDFDLTPVARKFLTSTPELRPVPFWWIITFLGVYVFLIGPVDYFILRRFNRLRYTWLTFFLYVVIFAGIAYLGAYSIRGGKTFSREFAIRDEVSGAPFRHFRDYFGLYSAQKNAFDIRFGVNAFPLALGEFTPGGNKNTNGQSQAVQRAALIRQMRLRRQNGRFDADGSRTYAVDGLADAIVQGEEGEIQKVPIQHWSMKYFMADRFTENAIGAAAPLVTGDLHYTPEGKLTGSFRLRSKTPLTAAVLVGRYGVYTNLKITPGTVWAAESRQPTAIKLIDYLADLKNIKTDDPENTPQEEDEDGEKKKKKVRIPLAKIIYRSLPRLLVSLRRGYRQAVLRGQFYAPLPPEERRRGRLVNYSTSLSDKTFQYLPKVTYDLSQLTPPRAGLSLEQTWNALPELSSERQLNDLSNLIREGSLVLFLAIDKPSTKVNVDNWDLVREGVTFARVVFPPDRNEGGLEEKIPLPLWRDDILGDQKQTRLLPRRRTSRRIRW